MLHRRSVANMIFFLNFDIRDAFWNIHVSSQEDPGGGLRSRIGAQAAMWGSTNIITKIFSNWSWHRSLRPEGGGIWIILRHPAMIRECSKTHSLSRWKNCEWLRGKKRVPKYGSTGNTKGRKLTVPLRKFVTSCHHVNTVPVTTANMASILHWEIEVITTSWPSSSALVDGKKQKKLNTAHGRHVLIKYLCKSLHRFFFFCSNCFYDF